METAHAPTPRGRPIGRRLLTSDGQAGLRWLLDASCEADGEGMRVPGEGSALIAATPVTSPAVGCVTSASDADVHCCVHAATPPVEGCPRCRRAGNRGWLAGCRFLEDGRLERGQSRQWSRAHPRSRLGAHGPAAWFAGCTRDQAGGAGCGCGGAIHS